MEKKKKKEKKGEKQKVTLFLRGNFFLIKV